MPATCDDLRLGGTDVSVRFWSKVDASGDCWLWVAGRTPNGYGKFKIAGQSLGAHRVAWRLLVGPIPDGLAIDHLCKVKRCVNPDHLEPVTPRSNVMRSSSWAARQAGQTHCKRGHPLSGPNLARWGKRGHRFCRICHRERTRAWRAANANV